MSIEDVRTLVAERQRYDDWLAALEAKRAETPVRVFERVHGDYLGRRDAVLEKLREHVGTLSTLADDLETRIAGLDSRLSALEDERAEAMLRTAVGEYDGDRWEVVRQEVEANIGTLSGERDGLLAEVDDVRTLLSSARAEPEPEPEPPAPIVETAATEHASASLPVETAASAFAAEESAPTLSEMSGHAATESTAAAGAASASSLESPSEVQATEAEAATSHDGAVDAPAGAPASESTDWMPMIPTTATPASSTPIFTPVASYTTPTPLPAELPPTVTPMADPFAVSEAQQRQDELDASEFDDALALFSPSPDVTPEVGAGLGALDMLDGIVPVPPQSEPTSPRADDLGYGVSPAGGLPSGNEGTRDPFDDLAFLRSVIDPATQNAGVRNPSGTEPQKTLRCTECGTMNFPTEWYCERCGGELAAF